MSTDEYFFALVDAQDRASHKGLLQEYVSNRTRHNMDGIREFMRTLITYDYPELLHIYMRNNALQYTIDDLESACSETNKNVILEIVNNKILPNEKCVEYVLQQFDECNSYRIYNSMCHIIAIFIHCGYTIPDHVLQRVLQNAQNMLTDDMHAIFKYGFDRPAIDIFIPRY